MRMTNQREIILEELRGTTSHPTADELYLMVKKRLPRISLATVYRNLEQMADLGIIQKIDTAGSQKRFDGNPELHYHIRCVRCGKVEDLSLEPVSSLERLKDAGEFAEYRIIGYRLDFVGICPECQAKEKDH